jgi:lysophospholipase L1-like esterase
LSLALFGSALLGLVALLAPSPRAAAATPEDKGPAVAHGLNGTVVHIGDSFVDAGLQQALRPRFKAEQTRYFSFGKRRAWVATWAYGAETDSLYNSYRPSLFIITVGANDLVFPRPAERVKVVRDLVKKMRDTPCVWISTPLWAGAPTAYLDMIRQESAPCRYFDSEAVNPRITKQPDGRHPDLKGGAIWAEAFWDWLMAERDTTKGYWALKPSPPDEHAPRAAASGSAAPSLAAPPKN